MAHQHDEPGLPQGPAIAARFDAGVVGIGTKFQAVGAAVQNREPPEFAVVDPSRVPLQVLDERREIEPGRPAVTRSWNHDV